jgi:hypothetical protein
MPTLTRWSIRAAMLYLIAGLAGLVIVWADDSWAIDGTWYAFRPVGIHLLTVGWLTQLIFAVIYWMFPIISRRNPRGQEWIGWLGFAGLNVGLLLRVVFEIGISWGMGADLGGWGLVVSAVVQWFGGMAWVLLSWNRVRERGGS